MSTETIAVTGTVEGTVEDEELKVVLMGPYNFEGKTYSEVDLSGLREITTQDMVKVQKLMQKKGTLAAVPELTLEFNCYMASSATGLPVEFFQGLPCRDGLKVKNKVTNFLFGEE